LRQSCWRALYTLFKYDLVEYVATNPKYETHRVNYALALLNIDELEARLAQA